MSSTSMPRTKEDLKRDILTYLARSVNEETPLEKIIYSGILDEMDEEPDKIDKALEELEEDKSISSHDVSFKVYLPRTDEGNELLKRLTSEELIAYSPYWLIVFSLAIFWIILQYFNVPIPNDFKGTTLFSAFQYAFRYSIVISAILGPVGAYFLKVVMGRLKRMKVLSPEYYYQIYEIAKYTIIFCIAGAFVYNYLCKEFGFKLIHEAVIFFMMALTIAIAYVQLKKEAVV